MTWAKEILEMAVKGILREKLAKNLAEAQARLGT